MSSACLETTPGPPLANIEADLRLVSQIGGLRAKSAQAQAANAKLSAAIYEARERHETERIQKVQLKQKRLRVIYRWLVAPRNIGCMRQCYEGWRYATVTSINHRRARKADMSKMFRAWQLAVLKQTRERANDVASKSIEVGRNQIARLRNELLAERRERRLVTINNEIVLDLLKESRSHTAISGPQRQASSASSAQIALPMGLVPTELLSFCVKAWHMLATLQYRQHGQLDNRFEAKRWDSLDRVLSFNRRDNVFGLSAAFGMWSQRTFFVTVVVPAHRTSETCTLHIVSHGWQRSYLLDSIFSSWRARTRQHTQRRLVGCALIGQQISPHCIPLQAITFSCWKTFLEFYSAECKLAQLKRQFCYRQQQAHLHILLSDLVSLWAMVTSKAVSEATWAAQFVEVRVLQRRALGAALSITLEFECSWRAALMLHRWFSETLRARCLKLQDQQRTAAASHCAARSRMIGLFHLSQLELRIEHLALAWITWRQWQSRQCTRKWRDQAQESLISTQLEQDAKHLDRMAALATLRSAFVDSRITLENRLFLRHAFGMFQLHVRTDSTTREILSREQDAAAYFASQRQCLAMRRERHIERVSAHAISSAARLVCVICICFWRREVKTSLLGKHRITTTEKYIQSVEKSSPWVDLLPVYACWSAWRMYAYESWFEQYLHARQHESRDVRAKFSSILGKSWMASCLQLCVNAWYVLCAHISSSKKLRDLDFHFHQVSRQLETEKSERKRAVAHSLEQQNVLSELEVQCDELSRRLESEKCDREKAVAKFLKEQETRSAGRLEVAVQSEPDGCRQRHEEAEKMFRHEAHELRCLHDGLVAMVEQLQHQHRTPSEFVAYESGEVQRLMDEVETRIGPNKMNADSVVNTLALLSSPLTAAVAQQPPKTRQELFVQECPMGQICPDDIERALSDAYDPLGATDPQTGSIQVQSPLTASSLWVENVWGSTQLAFNASGINDASVVPQEAQAEQSVDAEEEQFIRRCGELTRRQEAFVAQLKAHPDVGLDDLRSELTAESIPRIEDPIAPPYPKERFEQWAWHDASLPLCAVVESPMANQNHGEELFSTSQDCHIHTDMFLDAALVPSDSQFDVTSMRDPATVERRLSFGSNVDSVSSSKIDMPATMCYDPADTCNGSRSERCVRFNLTEEVIRQPISEVISDILQESMSARNVRNQLAGEFSKRCNGNERIESHHLGVGPLEHHDIIDSCQQEVASVATNTKLQGMEHPSKRAEGVWRWRTWSPGDLPSIEGDSENEVVHIRTAQDHVQHDSRNGSSKPEEEESYETCPGTELQLAELRQRLFDGLPDFSCGIATIPPETGLESSEDWEDIQFETEPGVLDFSLFSSSASPQLGEGVDGNHSIPRSYRGKGDVPVQEESYTATSVAPDLPDHGVGNIADTLEHDVPYGHFSPQISLADHRVFTGHSMMQVQLPSLVTSHLFTPERPEAANGIQFHSGPLVNDNYLNRDYLKDFSASLLAKRCQDLSQRSEENMGP